jgi:excisionase family DNA binding protein
MAEAARMLGVSHTKLWRLVRDGTLSAQENPLDRRVKLIRREDVERLKGQGEPRRRFHSDGIDADPVDVPSTRIKDWVRDSWHAPEG